jgi:hypothetical protein
MQGLSVMQDSVTQQTIPDVGIVVLTDPIRIMITSRKVHPEWGKETQPCGTTVHVRVFPSFGLFRELFPPFSEKVEELRTTSLYPRDTTERRGICLETPCDVNCLNCHRLKQ